MIKKCSDTQSTVVCAARRTLLVRSAGLLGGLALTLLLGTDATEAAKAAKDDFLYQDHPKDDKDCARCKFFAPADANADTGACAIVSGVVSRGGWCLAYSPRV